MHRFKVAESKVEIVSNGVDLPLFQTLIRNGDLHRGFLYVGRLEKYKRVDRVIEALKYLEDNVYLEIVGKGPDKNRLLRLSKMLRQESHVAQWKDHFRAFSDRRQNFLESSIECGVGT